MERVCELYHVSFFLMHGIVLIRVENVSSFMVDAMAEVQSAMSSSNWEPLLYKQARMMYCLGWESLRVNRGILLSVRARPCICVIVDTCLQPWSVSADQKTDCDDHTDTCQPNLNECFTGFSEKDGWSAFHGRWEIESRGIGLAQFLDKRFWDDLHILRFFCGSFFSPIKCEF